MDELRPGELFELKPGEKIVFIDHEFLLGDPCPNCGGQDCEYREKVHPTRKGYLLRGVSCINCGQKTVCPIRDPDTVGHRIDDSGILPGHRQV